MAWVRIDDQVPHHLKMLKAGPAACWLWVCGLAYCQRQLTDGVIAREALPMLGVPKPDALARILLSVGLWHQHDAGFSVHDYHDHNPRAEDVRARRKEETERLREARNRSKRTAVRTSVQPAYDAPENVRGTEPSRARVPNPNPNPNPNPSTGAVAPGVTRPPEPVARIAFGPHKAHAACGRLCVPDFLHEELRAKIPGDEDAADTRLRAWYRAVNTRLDTNGEIAPADALTYWRKAFDAEFAVARPPTPSAAEDSPPDAERIARMIANIEAKDARLRGVRA